MHSRIALARLLGATLLALTLLSIAGCSGGSDATDAAKESAPAVSEPAPTALEIRTARIAKRKLAVKRVVTDYYESLDGREFQTAWNRLGASVRQRFRGYDVWSAGFATTVRQTPRSVRIVHASTSSASVSLVLRTVDEDVCGARYRQTFSGTWELSKAQGRWIAQSIAMNRVAGTAPPSDPTCIDPPEAPENERPYDDGPEDPGDCHPSYEGACLDPNSIDYDCSGGSGDGPDYTGPVQVIGYDDFGLDRDGDGYACE